MKEEWWTLPFHFTSIHEVEAAVKVGQRDTAGSPAPVGGHQFKATVSHDLRRVTRAQVVADS